MASAAASEDPSPPMLGASGSLCVKSLNQNCLLTTTAQALIAPKLLRDCDTSCCRRYFRNAARSMLSRDVEIRGDQHREPLRQIGESDSAHEVFGMDPGLAVVPIGTGDKSNPNAFITSVRAVLPICKTVKGVFCQDWQSSHWTCWLCLVMLRNSGRALGSSVMVLAGS